MWKYRIRRRGTQPQRTARLPKRGSLMRRLRKDERGATAIEFGIVGLALIYFIVGIIEFSLTMTVGNSLEAATNMSSRLGKTGYTDEEALLTQQETIYREIERRVGPLIDMEQLDITHEVFNDFKSLTSPDILKDENADGDTDDPGEWTDVDGDGFKDGAPGIGSSGNIVVYRISYPWQVITPLMGNIIGDGGIIDLTAYSVVKNEPY
jgi:Flp pilus assembly pilin Flp